MITKNLKGDRLLEIDNAHIADCGPPPSINAEDKYIGYFENSVGEQWVFIGDRQTGKALIHGGDIGWEDGKSVSLECPCPDIILAEPEKTWVVSCFVAMTNAPFEDVIGNYNKAAANIAISGRLVADLGKNSVN